MIAPGHGNPEVIHLDEGLAYLKIDTGGAVSEELRRRLLLQKNAFLQHELATEHHDPVKLLRATVHSKKAIKRKKRPR